MTVEWLSPSDLLVPGTAVGAGIWLFYRLIARSDRRERDLFREMKQQRDEWRERAETAEGGLSDCMESLTRLRVTGKDDGPV